MFRRVLTLLVPLAILGSADAMAQEQFDTVRIVIPEHEAFILMPRDTSVTPPPVDSIPVPPVDTLPEDSIPMPPIIGDVLTNRMYSSLTAPNWYDRTTGHFTIIDDSGAPISPPRVGRARFSAGRTGGTAPTASTYTFAPGVTAVDFTFALKFSANWQNHKSGVNKVIYFGVRGQNNENALVLYGCPDCGNPDADLRWRATFHGNPFTFSKYQNANGQPFERDRWYTIRIFMQMESSPSASDGIFKLWADGVLKMDHTDIRYIQVGSNSRHFARVKWTPVWGGTGDTVTQTMYQYMDNIEIKDASP